jgi:hypothetical protein
VALCVDANVLIQAKQREYPMDIVPGFWDAIDRFGTSKHLFVIHGVYNEILDGKDELAAWMKPRKALVRDERKCAKTNQAYAQLGAAVAARKPPFTPPAVAKFHSGADPWVVAFAAANDHTVVTMEVAAPLRTAEVKMPDACKLLNVPMINTYQLLRQLGVQLIMK